MYETDKSHFKLFKKEVAHWVDFFGLKGWNILFIHDEMILDHASSLAVCSYELEPRSCTMAFNAVWPIPVTKSQIKLIAFHETCELLIGRLFSLGNSRWALPRELDEERHNIIRTLEGSIFKTLKDR